jgi:Histidine kinase-, DNA gyrase B-, and HSP90-like ATPase
MENAGIVKANANKEFFIEMLTKDIRLEYAIIDLMDNSLDGALTKNAKNVSDLSDLFIDITANPNQFIIKDNCGGFSLDTAINYAFQFGRPKGRADVENSVGRFGVGMKRALFKMGKSFIVESKCGNDHFRIEVDVVKWSSDADKDGGWNFNYEIGGKYLSGEDEDGTLIIVNDLYSNIKAEFSSNSFLTYLQSEIEKKHEFNLEKGIKLTLNTVKLGSNPVKLLISDRLEPIYKELSYGGVNVKIYGGLGKADLNAAGWYIYCNDRLIIEREQTNLTGWASDVAKFHHNFAMFRGIVLFYSKDPKLLPLTTTKTGIDTNSDIYRAVKEKMVDVVMRPLISYLRKLTSDEEREEVTNDALETNVSVMSHKVYSSNFLAPPVAELKKTNTFVTISYKKERKMVEKVMKELNLNSNKEIGEITFDYYFNNEIAQ